jgi:hypothetical protein
MRQYRRAKHIILAQPVVDTVPSDDGESDVNNERAVPYTVYHAYHALQQ